MVKKAADDDMLQPLARRALQHRISLYADDVVIFLHSSASDLEVMLDLLQLFGEASGLKTNVQKSSVLPIQCLEDDKAIIQEQLPCQILDFPCKYLGVPLSLRKLSKAQIQPIIDKIADQLPGWKADLLTRAGRKVLVQFVLTSMLVYLVMAMDLPPWALKAIDKIRRGFLWKGRKDVNGGHCLLAWPKVARPQELGGLGISSLQQLGWALRMRWLWLQKTEPDKPWASFAIQVHPAVHSFFSIAIKSEVGNGRNTLFWTDRWLHGQRLDDLVPNLFGAISSRARKRTVQDALTDHRWVRDIRGALSLAVLREYLAFGTSSQTLCCTQILRILMCGNSPPQGSIQQNLPMSPCSLEPLLSGLGKEFGKVGPQINANSSCGWLHITDVGQLTASLEEICHIQNAARCVTKLRKR